MTGKTGKELVMNEYNGDRTRNRFIPPFSSRPPTDRHTTHLTLTCFCRCFTIFMIIYGPTMHQQHENAVTGHIEENPE